MNQNKMNDNKISIYIKEMEPLFAEWKSVEPTEVKGEKTDKTTTIDHKNKVFIKDGVVCPKQWFSQEIRPLFLLKEAYGGNKDWNLIDFFSSKKRMSKMWSRVAHWTYGLMNTTANRVEPYSDYSSSTYAENKDLKQIAVINVKKSSGEKTSDWELINAYAEFDKDRLMEQIELCDPTIIVCGYTGTPLEIIVNKSQPGFRKKRNENLFYHINIKGHDVLVLDYWHPANQYPDLMNYYTLMGIYQQALLDMGKRND